jgi:hypothetical protein
MVKRKNWASLIIFRTLKTGAERQVSAFLKVPTMVDPIDTKSGLGNDQEIGKGNGREIGLETVPATAEGRDRDLQSATMTVEESIASDPRIENALTGLQRRCAKWRVPQLHRAQSLAQSQRNFAQRAAAVAAAALLTVA